ncbi:unannotated protein [freshwater metagenome]|jgi:cell division protein FtsL|uniref:Unannotated protein n=1 Tax=freshwater metagenome TaxID=449393 RepID=A0A6J7MNE0_9ZZZZ|nr:hypothetical protein [Actinomycetota bacterium]MSX47913.1 hypothetical protein [Actinomycetota bacterium]MSX62429.1 hypothetical protein [Actinomycetota bacterium]MSY09178.1 hypothetical protein [Actinomycetota bacterium]MSY54439.1 hypothetical protein [Actinomycetota bacterium]
MAITSLAPEVNRAKKSVIEKSSKAVLRLVPDLGTGERADNKAFVTFVSAVGVLGLLLLLGINTLLAQGAFELHRLQTQATTLSDQREAILAQIAKSSSPEQVAANAKKLGMVPSIDPRFLAVDPATNTGAAK